MKRVRQYIHGIPIKKTLTLEDVDGVEYIILLTQMAQFMAANFSLPSRRLAITRTSEAFVLLGLSQSTWLLEQIQSLSLMSDPRAANAAFPGFEHISASADAGGSHILSSATNLDTLVQCLPGFSLSMTLPNNQTITSTSLLIRAVASWGAIWSALYYPKYRLVAETIITWINGQVNRREVPTIIIWVIEKFFEELFNFLRSNVSKSATGPHTMAMADSLNVFGYIAYNAGVDSSEPAVARVIPMLRLTSAPCRGFRYYPSLYGMWWKYVAHGRGCRMILRLVLRLSPRHNTLSLAINQLLLSPPREVQDLRALLTIL